MYDKLDFIQEKYEELSLKVSDPEVIADQANWQKYAKDLGEMEPIVQKYSEYKKVVEGIREAKEILADGGSDEEMRELAKRELSELEDDEARISEELKILLIPKDPNDQKNVILEVRAGTGGDEAALFGADLLRMYMRYAERRGWKTEIMDSNDTGIGGIKEASVLIKGKGAYSRLKYESGVHRVQRVPETESQGRIHTSTVTVAVLVEADEVELEINPSELKIDVFRASGAGGQHINKTESAVRITHLPTGTVVECQDERSQFKNKERAMKILRSRLYEALSQEQADKIASERKMQVGTGDRSERIRTYNYPQGRITDHRIGLTLYKLDDVLNGHIEEVIDALATADQAAKLAMQNEN